MGTCVFLVGLAALPNTSFAQVVVADPAGIVQQTATVKNLLEQLANLKEQLNTQKGMYGAMTGAGGYGSMRSDSTSTLQKNLPADWSRVYSDAMNNDSSITGSVRDMMGQFDQELASMSRSDALDLVRKRMTEKGAYDRVMAEQAYNNQMRELQDIEALTQQIDSTKSQKEISDLSARIQTASGAIQGEQTKLQLMSILQQSQDKMYQQQQEKAVRRYVIGDDDDTFEAPNLR